VPDEVRMVLRDAHIVYGRRRSGALLPLNLQPPAIVSAKLIASLQLVRVNPASTLHPEGMLCSRADGPAVHVQVEGRQVVFKDLLHLARNGTGRRIVVGCHHDKVAAANLLDQFASVRGEDRRSRCEATPSRKGKGDITIYLQ
jgi:hypothetical protein